MKLDAADLTVAAEALGLRSPPPLRYLRALARHPDPVVREGAIYGLAAHRDTEIAGDVLRSLATNDPSPLIQSIAAEALES